MVHDFDEGYGQGRYCIELARHLANRFEFLVASATIGDEVREMVEWVRIPSWRRSALTTVFSFRRNAGSVLASNVTDVVHSQGMTGGSPDVITAHVCNAARRGTLRLGAVRSGIFARIVAPFERAYYRQASVRRIIAISSIVDAEVRNHYGWRGPRSVIYHGTDTERFRPAEPGERDLLRRRVGLSADDRVWLFMGEAEKGLADVIMQLPGFCQARLLVVSRSELEPFRQLAIRLGVNGRVIFHGADPRPELFHRMADVFVYPSRYDTFGLVVTEAMASGTPVIVGHRIGAAELMEHGVNGFVCDPDSPLSIETAMRCLEENGIRASQIGLAGRQTVERNTWAQCAEATARVYDEILACKRAVPGA